MGLIAMHANDTNGPGDMSGIIHSANLSTKSGSTCAFCGTTLEDSQVYCCTACEVRLMLDPNYRLSGEDNDA